MEGGDGSAVSAGEYSSSNSAGHVFHKEELVLIENPINVLRTRHTTSGRCAVGFASLRQKCLVDPGDITGDCTYRCFVAEPAMLQVFPALLLVINISRS